MAQLANGLVFDLADSLPGDAENLAYFFQGVGAAVVHAEAHPQHISLPVCQGSPESPTGPRPAGCWR